jgi:hypothetical protein
MRKTLHTYQDPLDVVWLNAAGGMGMRIERDAEVFASWDGSGVLRIGVPETLDPDDCLAQMILHEACHGLIEGPDSFTLPDWGLQIDNPAHRIREHACLRLQAALTTPFGLRDFLAATTTFRRYYDQLPPDPLQEDGDPAVAIALTGFQLATRGPWAEPISTALMLTSRIAEIVRPFATADSLWTVVGKKIDVSS